MLPQPAPQQQQEQQQQPHQKEDGGPPQQQQQHDDSSPQQQEQQQQTQTPAKRRGRPPGVKNKATLAKAGTAGPLLAFVLEVQPGEVRWGQLHAGVGEQHKQRFSTVSRAPRPVS
jgi:hypothetical protein